MLRLVVVIFSICLVGCQSAKYTTAEAPKVPEITHAAPKNPIDTELINWQPYGKNVDKTTGVPQKFTAALSKYHASDSLKKRLMVVALDSALKEVEENLKLALFCSGNFVIMERPVDKHRETLTRLASQQEIPLTPLADSLYAQYLLLLTGEEKNPKVLGYNLLAGQALPERTITDKNVLLCAEHIVEELTPERWQGKITSSLTTDNTVVISGGSLDGIKKGDTFVVRSQTTQVSQEEIVIEEVEDKYAKARIMGADAAIKGMVIETKS